MDALRDDKWYDERVRRMFVAKGLTIVGGYAVNGKSYDPPVTYAFVGSGTVTLPNGVQVPSRQVDSVSVGVRGRRVELSITDDAGISRSVVSSADRGWYMSRTAPYVLGEELGHAMPRSPAETADAFDRTWPNWRELVAMDDDKGYIAVREGFAGLKSDVLLLHPTDNVVYCAVCEGLSARGYAGPVPSFRTVVSVLEAEGIEHSRCGVLDRLRETEWDGVPRAETFLGRAFGASATEFGLTDEESEEYVRAVSLAWLRGIAKRLTGAVGIDAVPVLACRDSGFVEGMLSAATMDLCDIRYTTHVRNSEDIASTARGLLALCLPLATLLEADRFKVEDLLRRPNDTLWLRASRAKASAPRRFGLAALSEDTLMFAAGTEDELPCLMPLRCSSERAALTETAAAEEARQVWAEALATADEPAPGRLGELASKARRGARRPVFGESAVMGAMGRAAEEEGCIIPRDRLLNKMTSRLGSYRRAVSVLDQWTRDTGEWELVRDRDDELVYRRRT